MISLSLEYIFEKIWENKYPWSYFVRNRIENMENSIFRCNFWFQFFKTMLKIIVLVLLAYFSVTLAIKFPKIKWLV